MLSQFSLMSLPNETPKPRTLIDFGDLLHKKNLSHEALKILIEALNNDEIAILQHEAGVQCFHLQSLDLLHDDMVENFCDKAGIKKMLYGETIKIGKERLANPNFVPAPTDYPIVPAAHWTEYMTVVDEYIKRYRPIKASLDIYQQIFRVCNEVDMARCEDNLLYSTPVYT